MYINILLLIIFALGWFWFDSTRVREQALKICQRTCSQYQVQLLDHTVMIYQIKLVKTPYGLRLRRVYSFEFSGNGESRKSGSLVMLGMEVEYIILRNQ